MPHIVATSVDNFSVAIGASVHVNSPPIIHEVTYMIIFASETNTPPFILMDEQPYSFVCKTSGEYLIVSYFIFGSSVHDIFRSENVLFMFCL